MKTKFLTIFIASVLLIGCTDVDSISQANAPKKERDNDVSAETAIRAAKLSIREQMADPISTTFEIDSVNQLNDTLFGIFGFFRTKNTFGSYDRVKFDCKIGLSRDGELFEMPEINTY